MTLPSQPRTLAGFLVVFALGFGVISLVPLPYGVQFVLGCFWLAGALWAGWKLFPAPVIPLVVGEPGPQLSVEPSGLVSGEKAQEASLVETLLKPADSPPPPDAIPVSTVRPDEWREVLELIESEWARSDSLAPALDTVLGNTAFIRENILRAYEIADNLAGSAQHAFDLSEKVQKGIKVVTDALVESLKQTEVLSTHSQRITGILELLEEVSDKIHVLSINASIVSARAGTSGRGFEVVAKEIRALAKETEHSLGDIVEVIDLFRGSIARVIKVVRDADDETELEKDSLIEVAGALQGVILGVEIVKAVSGFAREKSAEQEVLIKTLVAQDRGPLPETKKRVAAVKARLEDRISKE